MIRTKSGVALALVAGFSLLTVGACTRTQQYVGTGAALGAGTGAIVGAATGGSAVGGALIGGAVGAGAGYVAAHTH